MSYSDLITELKNYKKFILTNEEKSFLYKLITGHERALNIKSYLRLKNQEDITKEIEKAMNLEKYNFIESSKGKFLTKSSSYKITSHGIFYILTNIIDYPPQFLSRYSENIILQMLLFQYFETSTINSGTSEFYSIITYYLNQCMNFLKGVIGELQNLHGIEDSKEMHKKIEKELSFNIKYLVFMIAIKYRDVNLLEFDKNMTDDAKVIFYDIENKMKSLLSKDSKFTKLLETVNKEFNEGYNEIMQNKKNNETL